MSCLRILGPGLHETTPAQIGSHTHVARLPRMVRHGGGLDHMRPCVPMAPEHSHRKEERA